MTAMDDLVTWLRAQLDEDERVARAAHVSRPGPWAVRSDSTGVIEIYSVVREEQRGGDSNVFPDAWHPEASEHAARWNPARVLAEVEAKRRLLDLHKPVPSGSIYKPGPLVCTHCAELCHSRSGLGCDDLDGVYPCPTVRPLALPYADRAGYREEWRP
jgi:hypothetical protein